VRGWFPREFGRARAVRRVVGRPVLRTGVSTVSILTFLYLLDVNQASLLGGLATLYGLRLYVILFYSGPCGAHGLLYDAFRSIVYILFLVN